MTTPGCGSIIAYNQRLYFQLFNNRWLLKVRFIVQLSVTESSRAEVGGWGPRPQIGQRRGDRARSRLRPTPRALMPVTDTPGVVLIGPARPRPGPPRARCCARLPSVTHSCLGGPQRPTWRAPRPPGAPAPHPSPPLAARRQGAAPSLRRRSASAPSVARGSALRAALYPDPPPVGAGWARACRCTPAQPLQGRSRLRRWPAASLAKPGPACRPLCRCSGRPGPCNGPRPGPPLGPSPAARCTLRSGPPAPA